jgi:hypothetical protein
MLIVLQSCSIEGVSGGVRRRSRVRRPRPVPRTHGSRAAPGTCPGTLRSPATGSLTDGDTSHRRRKARPRRPESAATERRKAPAGPFRPAANQEPVRPPALRPLAQPRTSVRREDKGTRPHAHTHHARARPPKIASKRGLGKARRLRRLSSTAESAWLGAPRHPAGKRQRCVAGTPQRRQFAALVTSGSQEYLATS